MNTLEDFFSFFHLSEATIQRVSEEAKAFSIDCGKQGSLKELTSETFDLLDDISEKLWWSNLPNQTKISIGFQLFETFPSYYHFLVPFYRGIRDKTIVEKSEKQLIWKQFMHYLAGEKYYADPVGYVLWVEFFEDESTVKEAWEGLIGNYSNRNSLLRLLEQSGPVPFELKQPIYQQLITDSASHEAIFKSLLYCAHDIFGKINKASARKILAKLNVDAATEHYRLLKEKINS